MATTWDYAKVFYWAGGQNLSAGWLSLGGETMRAERDIDALREMGRRGWELCAVESINSPVEVNPVFYFKRPVD